MKKIIIWAMGIAFPLLLSSQSQLVTFQNSKPFAVLNFLVSMAQNYAYSPALRDYVLANTDTETPEFKSMVSDFASVEIGYSFELPQFPKDRQYRSTKDLIYVAAVRARDIEDFGQRIIGILPNDDYIRLMRAMRIAEGYYDRVVWTESLQTQTKDLFTRMAKYEGDFNDIFNKINRFYGSVWSPEVPFIVNVYPIPGTSGGTSATPQGNTLTIGELALNPDQAGTMGVAAHEMSHILYLEQPAELQHRIDSAFQNHTSLYASYAYSFFNEGLATALGNGWAYKRMTGDLDPNDWYYNPTINTFGKALFPLCERYINEGKTIDVAFVNEAISIFEKVQPNAIYEYRTLFFSTTMFFDFEGDEEKQNFWRTLRNHFQVASYSGYSPMESSFEKDGGGKGTQCFVIDRSQTKRLDTLRKYFPQLRKVPNNQNGIAHFYDARRRPVIVIIGKDMESISRIMDFMVKQGSFEEGSIFEAVN